MSRSTSNSAIELRDDEPEERALPEVAAAGRRSCSDTPLVPSDCASAFEGTQNFQTVFEARYGKGEVDRLMPSFFIGTLQEAIREAFECPDERRPLALYIHHDGSMARHIFPTVVLCNEAVLSMLHASFIVWPWDVTAEENQMRLAEWLTEANLDDVRTHVDKSIGMGEGAFPMLVLLAKKGSKLWMVTHVIGREDPEHVMEKLVMCMEEYPASKVVATTNRCARRVNNDAPLIPSNCLSALEGTLSFSTVFEERYCTNGGPLFFIGSLQEAVKEAFDKPIIAERRPLALYIHQDGDTSNRAFPKKLCVKKTVALLRSNFVLWPWDVTAKENQVKLMTWLVESSLYDVISCVSDAIARSNNNGLSMMLLLTKNGEEVKVAEQIGEDDADKIFDTLTKVMEQYEDVKPPVASRKRSHPADE